MAGEQGHAQAQNKLGVLYSSGKGVEQDYTEAARWYRMAAEQGVAIAQFNLGGMYYTGSGIAHDYVLAHMWYNIASANGSKLAALHRSDAQGRMTREQVADAQARARVCMASEYQDCD